MGESRCKLAMKGSPKRITFVYARAILLLGTVNKDNGRSSPFGIASSHILEYCAIISFTLCCKWRECYINLLQWKIILFLYNYSCETFLLQLIADTVFQSKRAKLLSFETDTEYN